MTASNPYLIVRRIMDHNKLWGVKAKWNNQLYKITKDRLMKLIRDGKNVMVDLKKGDEPVSLQLYNDTAFRTIKDGHVCNNFSKVKSIQLVSANKLKILK